MSTITENLVRFPLLVLLQRVRVVAPVHRNLPIILNVVGQHPPVHNKLSNKSGPEEFIQNYVIFVIYLIISYKIRVFPWPRFVSQFVSCETGVEKTHALNSKITAGTLKNEIEDP